MKKSKQGILKTVVVLAVAIVTFSVVGIGQAETLLFEDFEGFELDPYVSPTETPSEDGTDWTDKLPAGWVANFYKTPVGNPIEFRGWRIHDVDSWVATEGDQQRSTWTRGGVGAHGSVLLVDPDAYDDGTNIDTGLFNASITTAAVDLSNIAANSVTLSLDSFFRSEVTSDLYIDVSFDGGSFSANVWQYISIDEDDGKVFDEHLSLALSNPESGSLKVKFSLLEGSNDWWWAIDNVKIEASAVPEPSSCALGGVALVGLAAMVWRRKKAAA